MLHLVSPGLLGIKYVQLVTDAYGTSIHSSHNCAPFELILSRASTYLSIDRDAVDVPRLDCKSKEDWVLRMSVAIAKSRVYLKKSQVRYKKKKLYRGMRRGNADFKEGDYVWLYIQDVNSKDKLGGHTAGPFEVLNRTNLTFVILRGKVV